MDGAPPLTESNSLKKGNTRGRNSPFVGVRIILSFLQVVLIFFREPP